MSLLGPKESLNDFMQVDHVIRVEESGTIHDDVVSDVYAPEFTVSTDEDGSILAEHEAEMIATVEAQGWELLTGWTGQYGYSGPIMHSSEFVGGGLEAHIRETPGYYAVVAVECDPLTEDGETEPAGWAIAYRENIA